VILTAFKSGDKFDDFTFVYWVEGEEYSKFQKVYMKYLVWDENAHAFRIMALICAGIFVLLILCCIITCIKSCCDKNKV
jgi:hypothetical protein